MKFADLGLAETLLRAVEAEGYHTATPVQIAAIPPILAGRDVLACAQTGTGKTAAFALPTLQRLSETPPPAGVRGRKIRVLALSPTRELARQICESFQNLWPQHLAAVDGCLRRRRPRSSGAGPAERCRHPDCHPWPAGRPDAAGPHRSDSRAGRHSRRSRPDARHGLCPRSEPHHAARSGQAADAAVLSHHARRDSQAGRDLADRCRPKCAWRRSPKRPR